MNEPFGIDLVKPGGALGGVEELTIPDQFIRPQSALLEHDTANPYDSTDVCPLWLKMASDLSAVWQTVRRTLREMPRLDESNTKMRIITPLLRGLGWDIYGGEVQTEYDIGQYGSKRIRVDYALFWRGAPIVFVEAKSLGTDLNDDHAGQATSYARLQQVGWCILTNGRQWRVYNAGWGREPKNTLFEIIELDPEGDLPQRLLALSKRSVTSGDLDKLGQKSRFSQRVRASLSSALPDLKTKWRNEAGNTVYSEVRGELEGITRQDVKDAVRPLLQIGIKEPEDGDENGKPPGGPSIIRREALAELPDGLGVICPGKREGVKWLKRNESWGYKRIASGRDPRYFALYVSEDIREIRYLGRIKGIVDPSHPDSPTRETYQQDEFYAPGKKVILLHPGSLVELDPPIPLGEDPNKAPQNLRYCQLGDLRSARTLDDI